MQLADPIEYNWISVKTFSNLLRYYHLYRIEIWMLHEEEEEYLIQYFLVHWGPENV